MVNRDVEFSRILDNLAVAKACAQAVHADLLHYLIASAIDEAKYEGSQRKELLSAPAVSARMEGQVMQEGPKINGGKVDVERLLEDIIDEMIADLNTEGIGTREILAAMRKAVGQREIAQEHDPDLAEDQG
jgi:hypothetical protein